MDPIFWGSDNQICRDFCLYILIINFFNFGSLCVCDHLNDCKFWILIDHYINLWTKL